MPLQNSSGNYARIVPFAPVTFCAASDINTPVVTKVATYTDQTLGTPCALSAGGNNTSGPGCNNPGIADPNGNYTAFLAPGTYQVCVFAQNYLCELKTAASTSAGSGASFAPLQKANTQVGATADVQISNAIAALSAGSGIVWADYSGNQTWAACPTWGSGNVHIILYPVTYTVTPNCTVPAKRAPSCT